MAATVLLALSPMLTLAPDASAAAHAHWGAALEVVEPPDANPTTQSTDVNSVSCASAGNCSAVGEYDADMSQQALLVSENDGAWSAGAVLPDGAATSNQAGVLNSISCRSAGNCSAAGAASGRAPRS
jgi:hypothetical protein